jgi:hypothetical protein
MSRCVEWVMANDEAANTDQAVAICADRWERNQEEDKMHRKQFEIEVKEQREDGGQIAINTIAVDRDNDRVMPSGALIERYMGNPVVQWVHNYREPWATIGKTNDLIVNAEQIVADFTLRPAANEQDPQSIIRLLWSGGWVNAASVGFKANPELMEENDHGGYDFLEWELMEWSLVPIPANQEALRRTVKALDSQMDTVQSDTVELTCVACGKAYQCDQVLSTFVLAGNMTRLCPDCAAEAPWGLRRERVYAALISALIGTKEDDGSDEVDEVGQEDVDEDVDEQEQSGASEANSDTDDSSDDADDTETESDSDDDDHELPSDVLDALEEALDLIGDLLEDGTENDE